jgi:Abnormal spindle-like microcephaly-assoc'd, ASPM-SPD-2-Hydin
VVFKEQAIHTGVRNLSCAASLLLISWLSVGCAGSTQRTVPGVSLSANTVNFQTVAVGQQAMQTVTITNTGAAPLLVSSVSVSNQQFSVAGLAVPNTILPMSSATFNLTFAPTSSGDTSATATILTSASTHPASISLRGKGESAAAALVLTPSVVSFGNETVKSTATQNVTVQNTSGTSVSVQGITVAGAGFGYADISPGFSLAPNQKVTFQVWFTPKAAGPSAATLTLLSPSLSSPGVLSMSGDGVAPGAPTPTPVPSNGQSVNLSWKASSSDVIGYRVYRSDSSGSGYSALNGTAVSGLSYTDSSVSSGTTYYYVVTAVDSAGVESVYSNQATAVVP